MNLKTLLKGLGACPSGLDYVGEQTAFEAWNNCRRGDWMLWIAKERGVDLKVLTLAKVRCARLVEHLMKDERSISALVSAERFANGEITREDLDADADSAALVAAAAADAVAYAAATGGGAAYVAAGAAAGAAYAAAAASDYADYADADAVAYAAYDATYAASDYADADAAKKETLLKCANICRETIPFSLLNIEESL